MSFKKFANIQILPLASGAYGNGQVVFEKSAGKTASIYQNDSKINISASLKEVASRYDISDNPNDYIYEAVRAVTAEVPNENGDAFPKEELLRFDHRLAKAIYQTFILKPHHINHRTDNPKTARGVILDASYNDISEPLSECPSCATKTASTENRDKSGIHCIKCGTIVKDEFVELLLAIDTKKDPTFAKGVKSGALNSLSMGCEAGYTDCSICDNRAKTVAQFCTHIRSGNKKKMYKTASGMRMSYEKCGDVVFTEISRVDQPADPTALSKEVFAPINSSLEQESNLLILTARMNKAAQLGDANDVDLALEEIKLNHPQAYKDILEMRKSLEDIDKSLPGDHGDQVPADMSFGDYVKKHEEDSSVPKSNEELGVVPSEQSGNSRIPTMANKKVATDIHAELDTLLDNAKTLKENTVGSNKFKFANSYKDLSVDVTPKGNVRLFTPVGTVCLVRPNEDFSDKADAKKFATTVLTDVASNGLVDTLLKYDAILSPKTANVLEHHLGDFAGGREEGDTEGMPEGGDDDMADERGNAKDSLVADGEETDNKKPHDTKDMGDSVVDEHSPDHTEAEDPGYEPAIADEHSDMADPHSKKTLGDDVLDGAEFDHGHKKATKTAQEMPEMAAAMDKTCNVACAAYAGKMAADEECPCPPECECACECKCAEGKQAQAPAQDAGMPMMASKEYQNRLSRLYKNRLNKVQAEATKRVASAEKTATDKVAAKFLRAVKLAAKRQALNLEYSPFKAKLADVLMSEQDLDQESFYPGMDGATASHLIEAASSDGLDTLVESLVKRAKEFMGMNDEALTAIENDVKNLITVPVAHKSAFSATVRNETVRQAAVDGNLLVAPLTTQETIPDDGSRNNIRSALGATKVRRTAALINKK